MKKLAFSTAAFLVGTAMFAFFVRPGWTLAPGVTGERLLAVRIGMTEDQVTAILEEPIYVSLTGAPYIRDDDSGVSCARRECPPSGPRTFVYAVDHLYLGYDVYVNFKDGIVSSATVKDGWDIAAAGCSARDSCWEVWKPEFVRRFALRQHLTGFFR